MKTKEYIYPHIECEVLFYPDLKVEEIGSNHKYQTAMTNRVAMTHL
jgi:hypothetical protein